MTPGVVEVRLRYESEANARHLTYWPADQLEKARGLIDHWGIEGATGDTFGQWVIDNDAVYFEVIVPD